MISPQHHHLAGVRDLVSIFDTFLIDQFGVLHDGAAPYPGAVEALANLKASGKKILLISNSGRRSAPNEQRLLRLGFEPGSWDLFLSSGEVAWRKLAATSDGPKQNCLLIAREGDRSAIDGLAFNLVDDGTAADVVLLSGSEADRYDMDHYRRLLEPAAARKVPCFCTNPDKIMLTPAGTRFGAGQIAEVYAAMGGPVTWIGKPFPDIYETARTLLGNPLSARTACVGDSIEHDIAGGLQAGFSTVLVETGVLETASDFEKDELFKRYGAAPDYLLPAFVW
ncbi:MULTISPECIES: TIGR01459 family HAD-type hydrolase [Mesorhizobium]|uniref:TIGR01459 family HAD-type hydrolase n=1 Tax=Mesorhizobium denitrificans TaxID=2294114 RepID=A0A371XD53_9HYPH|nr:MULTISPECIES: TIGR01459 family HAD-type hydrolase [Mesorhizobium]RFC67168.1 TIGR01459 family HAD-type hydrolase [Mesorhizobium denitrificans]